MINLGISDLLSLIGWGWVSGLYSITQSTEPTQLMEFLGGLTNASWVSLTAFANLLAFNRFVLVTIGYSFFISLHCFPFRFVTERPFVHKRAYTGLYSIPEYMGWY